MAAQRLIVALPFLGLGCLPPVEPAGTPPMCEVDEDCDEGEICDEGICYGDPPQDLRFAAVLRPPAESNAGAAPLTATEIPELSIAQDGTISGLAFDEPVTVEAEVVLACEGEVLGFACDGDVPIEATVILERPSRFSGGPGFRRKLTASVRSGGAASLTFQLPPSRCERMAPGTPDGCSDGYDVLISPGSSKLGESPDAPTAEEVAPPARARLIADQDQSLTWRLGDPNDLKVVQGCLVNSAYEGVSGVEVIAEGKWAPLGELERASNEAITDEGGCFSLRLPRGMTEFFDILFEADPDSDDHQPLPRLRLKNLQVPLSEIGEHVLGDFVMPDVPIAREVSVRVVGDRGNGERVDVPGAKVAFKTELDPHPETGVEAEVFFTARGETDASGRASLEVPAMDATYEVLVVPPVDSEFGSVFDLEVEVSGTASGVIGEVRLPPRLAVVGQVADNAGESIKDALLTARPSPELTWALDPAQQAVLSGLSSPSATTGKDGSFFFWVDPQLTGSAAIYDFFVAPPSTADAPRYSFDAREAPQGSMFDLGTLRLPPTSWARGAVTDAAGQPVPGAQVKIFQIRDGGFCDYQCEPPAYPRGTFTADEAGTARIVLPDPATSSSR